MSRRLVLVLSLAAPRGAGQTRGLCARTTSIGAPIAVLAAVGLILYVVSRVSY